MDYEINFNNNTNTFNHSEIAEFLIVSTDMDCDEIYRLPQRTRYVFN